MSYKLLFVSDFVNYQMNYENGVSALKLKSFDEFKNVFAKLEKRRKYFWRGQRKDWPLKSSSDRNSKIRFLYNFIDRQKILDIILRTFKKRLNKLPKMPNIEDNKIWAIGQHYGLPTPLLDWTANPYIAAYFAFYQRKETDDNKYRIVYALNNTVRRLMAHPIEKRYVEFLYTSDLMIKNERNERNERLENQEGLFTKALNGIDIETNAVKKYCSKRPTDKEIIFLKIFIPIILRDEVLKFLETEKDITHSKLFPDYAGAVDICKIDLGIDDCCTNTPENNEN